jgi:hypothetical protein
MRLRFSIRDLLWLTVVAGLAVGWGLDHREQVNRFEAMNGPLKIQVYPITMADPNAVLKVLQTALAGVPVRLAVDTKSNFLMAQATPSQQSLIRKLIEKMEGKPVSSISTPASSPIPMRIPVQANSQRRPAQDDQIEQMPIVPPGDPH